MGLGRLRIVSKKVSNTLFSLVNKGYCPFQVDATNAQSTSTNYTRVAPLASLHNASPQCLNQTTSSSSTFNSSQDLLIQKLSRRLHDLRSRKKKNKFYEHLALDWDSNRCKDSVSQTNPSVVDQITITGTHDTVVVMVLFGLTFSRPKSDITLAYPILVSMAILNTIPCMG
ncbi:unnamed protein product [Rotaria sordida]|uniref:Uncharacterized protein n=1 Tax=Rotaria sordida TaxID=392033 RepID=A0A814DPF4_9BILA|nr:unnamed protein product [Rotaria sordida]CAF0957272.1 unnamed protein product [Rotaria sordida]CAF3929422.1 unnamed protein product [Rotaria sordida]